MNAEPTLSERKLLHAVLVDAPLREHVHNACIQELRARSSAASGLLDDIVNETEGATTDSSTFLEVVRNECLAAIPPDPPSRYRPWILRVAAAVSALAFAWVLTRPSPVPITTTVAPSPPIPVPAPPYDIVSSQPIADGIVVQTREHAVPVPRINDDELVSTFPNLSVVRTWDETGQAVVFVAHPAVGRMHRIH